MSRAIQNPSGPSGTGSLSGAGSYDKRGRFWAVTDTAGRLVCLAVYKKGAQEVLRRLAATTAETRRRPRQQLRPKQGTPKRRRRQPE